MDEPLKSARFNLESLDRKTFSVVFPLRLAITDPLPSKASCEKLARGQRSV